jgi:small conductance mechanosensitive channel
MEWSGLLEKIYTLLTLYGLRVVSAIAIFVIGRWVAKGITRLIERLMVKRKVDETLVSFVSNMGYVALLAFVIIAALNKLGIQTASFIAVIGCCRPGHRACPAGFLVKFRRRYTDDHLQAVQGG